MKCGAGLMSDEIALHRKLFGIASKEFMCLDCQAEYLRVDRERLKKLLKCTTEAALACCLQSGNKKYSLHRGRGGKEAAACLYPCLPGWASVVRL